MGQTRPRGLLVVDYIGAADCGLSTEKVALVRTVAAAAAAAWPQPGGGLRRGCRCGKCRLRARPHPAIGELHVEPCPLAQGRRVPHRPAAEIADEREAARQDAAMGQRVEQLTAMFDRARALADELDHRPVR